MARINKYPEVLNDLLSTVLSCLKENSIDETIAAKCADEITQAIGNEWSGCNVYIPKGIDSLRQQRDTEIYKEFNGKNYTDLAKKHRLSTMAIRKIIERYCSAIVKK